MGVGLMDGNQGATSENQYGTLRVELTPEGALKLHGVEPRYKPAALATEREQNVGYLFLIPWQKDPREYLAGRHNRGVQAIMPRLPLPAVFAGTLPTGPGTATLQRLRTNRFHQGDALYNPRASVVVEADGAQAELVVSAFPGMDPWASIIPKDGVARRLTLERELELVV